MFLLRTQSETIPVKIESCSRRQIIPPIDGLFKRDWQVILRHLQTGHRLAQLRVKRLQSENDELQVTGERMHSHRTRRSRMRTRRSQWPCWWLDCAGRHAQCCYSRPQAAPQDLHIRRKSQFQTTFREQIVLEVQIVNLSAALAWQVDGEQCEASQSGDEHQQVAIEAVRLILLVLLVQAKALQEVVHHLCQVRKEREKKSPTNEGRRFTTINCTSIDADTSVKLFSRFFHVLSISSLHCIVAYHLRLPILPRHRLSCFSSLSPPCSCSPYLCEASCYHQTWGLAETDPILQSINTSKKFTAHLLALHRRSEPAKESRWKRPQSGFCFCSET